MGIEKVVVPERSNASASLSVKLLVPLIEPAVPPLPICKVPELIVVGPL